MNMGDFLGKYYIYLKIPLFHIWTVKNFSQHRSYIREYSVEDNHLKYNIHQQ